jgi:hypothetical protein
MKLFQMIERNEKSLYCSKKFLGVNETVSCAKQIPCQHSMAYPQDTDGVGFQILRITASIVTE